MFGKLVRSLRKEHRDADGTQWTQQILADKAGVDKRTLERIEQGLLRKIDPDIVLRLVDALELTSVEREQFFFASMLLDNSNLASPQSDPEEKLKMLLAMLASLRLPAMLVDVYADVIAVNSGALHLFDLYDDLVNYPADEPAAHNIMRVIFARDSRYRTILGEEWSRNALHNIRFFRGITLRYRFHPYFRQTLAALWKLPAFRLYWERARVEDGDSTTDSLMYDYHHPNLGPIRYMASSSQLLTRSGTLYWAIYVPLDERTMTVFQNMVERYGTDVIQLAAWPKA
ncbi:MAG TPA: helix-turn-helix domain-containing protein [Herpetosiphonaceae bacterium]